MKLKRVELIKQDAIDHYLKTNPTSDKEHQSELSGDEPLTESQSEDCPW